MSERIAAKQSFELGAYAEAVDRRAAQLQDMDFVRRLWGKDASLWSDDEEVQEQIRDALGWLTVSETMTGRLDELETFRRELCRDGLTRLVHCGMGGSSMTPLVFQRSLTPENEGLSPTVLDTTDPETVLRVEREQPLEKTCFVVASKSGTTVETRSHGDHFYEAMRRRVGGRAGSHFAVITDPGSPLEELARERSFHKVFLNFPDIGGRYSALSYFGLAPGAAMGLDVRELLLRARDAAEACGPEIPVAQNPGVLLGVALGELARRGRDKVTFLMPPRVAALGLWLEQLLAESTGKEGTGILPVAEEPVGVPSAYGDDRFFAHFELEGEDDSRVTRAVAALRDAGHPVVTIHLRDPLDLATEFFRWEVATATAGQVLGINPFDQPNVQESKDNTERLLDRVREGDELPDEPPDATEGPLGLHGEEEAGGLREGMARFLGRVRPGDYVALMAYLPEEDPIDRALRELRLLVRDGLRVATTLGYGPRFLHSTGQIHKGGPDTGVFVQLTAEDADDASIPGEPFTFGVLKRAQAAGDLEALRRHGRRAVRVHLRVDPAAGLEVLRKVIEDTLGKL